LPALFENREIEWDCYVDESDPDSCLYDMIIGRDLMIELGIDICFSTAEIKWDNASIPMVSVDQLRDASIDGFEKEILYSQDPDATDAERIQNIVESKYCPADLRKVVNECTILDDKQKEILFQLLTKYENLFDGTLGTWKTDPIELELKEEGTKPYHAKPYPVPHSQEKKLKEEVQRLVEFGVLRKRHESKNYPPLQ
jgi:hypothetical protein